VSYVSSFKTSDVIGLDEIEVEAPLHSFPTNFERNLEDIFGGVVGYHRMLLE
jgi:hypothetical protein